MIRDLGLKAHVDLLRIGLPICVHTALEFWVFGTVGLMMGSLGTVQFGGHQIALSLAALSFMVPAGIGAAAATRVGNAVGRRDRSGARRAAAVTLSLGGGVMVLSATVFWTMPRLLSRAFTPDLELIAMASLLIPIAAAFQIVDGTQVVAAGVLRGATDTRWPALIVFTGFWLFGLPAGWVLAFVHGFGPRGLWWGLTAGLTIVAGLLVVRVRSRLRLPMERLLAEQDLAASRPLEASADGGP